MGIDPEQERLRLAMEKYTASIMEYLERIQRIFLEVLSGLQKPCAEMVQQQNLVIKYVSNKWYNYKDMVIKYVSNNWYDYKDLVIKYVANNWYDYKEMVIKHEAYKL